MDKQIKHISHLRNEDSANNNSVSPFFSILELKVNLYDI